jgi:hypothetical protein
MRINEFLFMFSKALNPGDYKILISRRKRDTMKYLLMLLFFSILIGFIFSIPKIIDVPNKIEVVLQKFESFNITRVDIQTKEPIVLLDFPRTVIDLTGNTTNLTNEIFLITKSDIMWKRIDPNLFDWRFFTTEKKQVGEFSDVIQTFGKINGGTYWLLFFFFLPSLFLFVYVFNLMKYCILIGLITLIGYIVIKIKKKKTNLFGVWRTAVFSSTIMITLDMAISPLFKYNFYLNVLPLLLYILMFVLAMLVISEKEIDLKKEQY